MTSKTFKQAMEEAEKELGYTLEEAIEATRKEEKEREIAEKLWDEYYKSFKIKWRGKVIFGIWWEK